MSDRPGGSGRAGGRATSTSQQFPSRPEPGPGKPVRSNGPERTPLPGSGPRARQPAPGPEGPALRVILVSRDKMLAGALRSLIETPGGVRMLDWYSEELDTVIRHADVVIVDMPPTLHERTLAALDGRFLGRTVVLLQEGEHVQALPPGPPRTVLYRPLQIGELWSAVTGVIESQVTDEVAPEQEAVLEREVAPGSEAGQGLEVELAPRIGQPQDRVAGRDMPEAAGSDPPEAGEPSALEHRTRARSLGRSRSRTCPLDRRCGQTRRWPPPTSRRPGRLRRRAMRPRRSRRRARACRSPSRDGSSG